MKTTIRPSILCQDGSTIYPTGLEWIIAFAIRGIPWAIEDLNKYIAEEGSRWAGDGI